MIDVRSFVSAGLSILIAMPAYSAASDQDAYLDLFEAYAPLSDCVRGRADRLPNDESERAEMLAKTDGFSRFQASAMRLLSNAGQARIVESVEDAPNDQAKVKGLVVAMSIFGMHNDEDEPMGMQLSRMRAIALLMVQMAKMEPIDCKPSQELIHLMEATTDVHP